VFVLNRENEKKNEKLFFFKLKKIIYNKSNLAPLKILSKFRHWSRGSGSGTGCFQFSPLVTFLIQFSPFILSNDSIMSFPI